MKHGFHDFAVGAGKHLPKHRAGNLNENGFRIVAVEAGRLKPGSVGVDADPGLDQVEKFIPDVWCFAFSSDLGSSYHRYRCYRFEKSQQQTISTGVKKLWKANLSRKASRLGVLARAGRKFLAPWIPVQPL